MQYEFIEIFSGKGHFSAKKAEHVLKREYYRAQLKEEVEKCMAHCIPCVLANIKGSK